MDKALTYDNINLIPKYSKLESRSLADTSVDLCGWKFKLPCLPANMQDVINVDIAKFLSENGYFYIYHRFGKSPKGTDIFIDNNLSSFCLAFLANHDNWKLISISTGVNEDSLKELKQIKEYSLRVDFITIDVALGHHLKVKNRTQWLKENFPNTKIIAGNVATPEAYNDLGYWGADIIKVGIGQGSICTTRYQTGFSKPMFSCVKDILDTYNKNYIGEPNLKPIIADGSIKHIGDISKSLVAGSTIVMSGKLFASCIDSPAQIVNNQKQYRGSTSFAVKKHNKHIEGKTIELEADITIKERLIEIQEALQSAISYAGGHNLEAFKNVDYCIVDNN
jgi:GMP reductase